jgi:hypothetical protein
MSKEHVPGCYNHEADPILVPTEECQFCRGWRAALVLHVRPVAWRRIDRHGVLYDITRWKDAAEEWEQAGGSSLATSGMRPNRERRARGFN